MLTPPLTTSSCKASTDRRHSGGQYRPEPPMPPASTARQERFPWEPESVNRANLTTASLRQLLLQKIPAQGADAQSLLVAAGALVGFAAQNSALEQGELL